MWISSAASSAKMTAAGRIPEVDHHTVAEPLDGALQSVACSRLGPDLGGIRARMLLVGRIRSWLLEASTGTLGRWLMGSPG